MEQFGVVHCEAPVAKPKVQICANSGDRSNFFMTVKQGPKQNQPLGGEPQGDHLWRTYRRPAFRADDAETPNERRAPAQAGF
jgi:hypothetical protein